MKNISRRAFLKGMSVTAGAAALASVGAVSLAEGANETTFADTIAWNAEYDAVVVGFGAGAIAAIDMADAGLDVVVLEKAPYGHEGGNTRYSSQRFLHVDEDARDQMITYMKNVRGLYENMGDDVIEFLVDGFTKTTAYYEKLGGAKYELKHDPEFPAFEGSDIVTKCYTMNNDGKGFWPVIRAAAVERADHIHVWY
jgi:succinate dehydrogenase/fumarate reductase flavoprotein subunit